MPSLRKTKGRDRPRHREVNPREGKGMRGSRKEEGRGGSGERRCRPSSENRAAGGDGGGDLQGRTGPPSTMSGSRAAPADASSPGQTGFWTLRRGELSNTLYARRGEGGRPKSEQTFVTMGDFIP